MTSNEKTDHDILDEEVHMEYHRDPTGAATPMEAYYRQLESATILEVGMRGSGPDATPVLKVRLRSGDPLELQVWQDAEGSGPGFISGLPEIVVT